MMTKDLSKLQINFENRANKNWIIQCSVVYHEKANILIHSLLWICWTEPQTFIHSERCIRSLTDHLKENIFYPEISLLAHWCSLLNIIITSVCHIKSYLFDSNHRLWSELAWGSWLEEPVLIESGNSTEYFLEPAGRGNNQINQHTISQSHNETIM